MAIDLASLIAEEGALSPAQVAELARQLGGALDRAHAAGIVHGDLCAASVLLPGAGAGPEVDNAIRSGPASSIAPEQILGRSVDRRADVYALACVMFEALVGCEPFVRESAEAARRAHVDDERPRASEYGAAVSARVDDVLRRGMARDPAQRHPSAGAFGDELAAALTAPERSPAPRWSAPALGLALLGFGAVAAWALLGRDEGPTGAREPAPVTLTRTTTVDAAVAPGPAPGPAPLVRVHRANGGLRIRYPAGWRVRSSPRSRVGSTVEFEYVTIASGPLARAPMYVRIVVAGRDDTAFFANGDLARTLGKARASARSAFAWTTSFRGARGLRVAGTAGRRADLSWQVEKGYAGLGFAFAARNRRDGRWLYGFALYDTWDAERLRAGRVQARRDTLRAVVAGLRWG